MHLDETKLFDFASRDEQVDLSVEYIAGHLRRFLKRHETVLICFPNEGDKSLGGIFSNAVHRVGAVPLCCGSDFRWKTILRLALQRRATAVFAPPSVALGLAKAARATNTPISIRSVILSGYPTTPWIVDGIKKWLDCTVYGCYTPGCSTLVAGFNCCNCYGVHLRSDIYSAEVDEQSGEVILKVKDYPDACYRTGETGRIVSEACDCGNDDIKIVDLKPGIRADKRMMDLDEQLLAWSSILDYRAMQTSFGIDLEVVVFPREKLPHLPSCAKLSLRAWDPERDEPFYYQNASRIPQLPVENC